MSVLVHRLLRGLGWVFIAAGVVVLLYLVYSLLYTNRATAQAQRELRDEWNLSLRDGGDATAGAGGAAEVDGAARARGRGRGRGAPDLGSAVAAIEFRRPGLDEALVHKDPLFVVHGVGLTELQRGPGHYPGTALPGERGNFAVAGHRTTYGAPFFNLDQLRNGDEVRVTARDGERFTYQVRAQQIVLPGDTWVIAPDPLDRGKPTLTLTTCNPRFSAAQRLVVFAELAA